MPRAACQMAERPALMGRRPTPGIQSVNNGPQKEGKLQFCGIVARRGHEDDELVVAGENICLEVKAVVAARVFAKQLLV